ncbi:TLDc domain-containing protein [Entamoeba marina]
MGNKEVVSIRNSKDSELSPFSIVQPQKTTKRSKSNSNLASIYDPTQPQFGKHSNPVKISYQNRRLSVQVEKRNIQQTNISPPNIISLPCSPSVNLTNKFQNRLSSNPDIDVTTIKVTQHPKTKKEIQPDDTDNETKFKSKIVAENQKSGKAMNFLRKSRRSLCFALSNCHSKSPLKEEPKVLSPLQHSIEHESTPLFNSNEHSLRMKKSPVNIAPFQDYKYYNAGNKKELLKKWTGLSNFEILYNSGVDELSARCFNSKITGNENVMVLLQTTDNELFGFFHGSLIPSIKERVTEIHSNEYFLFILQSYNTNPRTIKRKKYNNPVSLSCYGVDTMECIFTCDDAFSLTNDSSIIFDAGITEFFDIPSLFVFSKPTPILNNLMAIRWF